MQNIKTPLLSACVLVAVMTACPVFAEDAAPQAQPVAPAKTEASPYMLKTSYMGEIWDNSTGGLKRGTVYMQNFDTQLRIDAEKAWGWTGGRFLFEGYYNSSRSIDNFVGTQDSPSPNDTYGATSFRLYQAYYDQDFGSTDVLFGVWDPQTEFANSEPQNVMLNRNFTWNAALDLSGQSLNFAGNYPWTPLALRVRQELGNHWAVQGEVQDGMADTANDLGRTDFQFKGEYGLFGMVEVNYQPTARNKFMVGYWGYTGKHNVYNEFEDDGSGNTVNRKAYGSGGGYIGGSARLYTYEGRRGLDGFANIGFADPATNQVDKSLNVGLTYTGAFDARPRDRIGLAMNVNGASAPYRKDQVAQGNEVSHYETTFEATYHAPITDWLKVQPDIQYIIRPNMDPTLKNDLVFGVHFEIGRWFNL